MKKNERSCRLCLQDLNRSEIVRGIIADSFICKKCFLHEERKSDVFGLIWGSVIGIILISIIIAILRIFPSMRG